MDIIKKYAHFIGLVAALAGLVLFLLLTNPNNLSIGWLVIPAVLLFFIAYCAVQVFFTVFRVMKGQSRKQRTAAMLSASLLTVIAILQSTGGISGADVLILGLIIVVAVLYINKF